MRSILKAPKTEAQKMEAQKNEARKAVLGSHTGIDLVGALVSRVLDDSEALPSDTPSSEMSSEKTSLGSQGSDASPLDWDDHLLFKSIHEQMKVLRESISRLEYVTSEVQGLIPRS